MRKDQKIKSSRQVKKFTLPTQNTEKKLYEFTICLHCAAEVTWVLKFKMTHIKQNAKEKKALLTVHVKCYKSNESSTVKITHSFVYRGYEYTFYLAVC